MKKQLISVIILIFITFPLSAQKSKDILYLKNGSKIFGQLTEVTDSLYKITTEGGSIFIFRPAEVEKFVNESQDYEGRKQNGVGLGLEAGILAGAQNSNYDSPFSFNLLLNLTRNTSESLGLGSGVEFLGQPFMPIFIEYRHIFSTKKATPFIFVRGGKLFHMNGDAGNTDPNYPQYDVPHSYSGGGSFTIGTGISWSKQDYETYLSFAYRNAHTSYDTRNYNNTTYTYRNSYNRLEVKFGFRF
jgi:hypothetical protein